MKSEEESGNKGLLSIAVIAIVALIGAIVAIKRMTGPGEME